MNHPTREEWMSYLYDELSAGEHGRLAAHLAVCPDGEARGIEGRVARKDLDAWQLPVTRARVVRARPLIKWAAAASIVLAAGFGVGRITSTTADAEKVRIAIEPEIRQQLRREFVQLLRDELQKTTSTTLTGSMEQTRQLLGQFANTIEAKRTEDSQAISAALNKLESQRVADFVSLKKDVDMMAVLTEAGLRRAQQQLVQLADYTQPANSSNSPQK